MVWGTDLWSDMERFRREMNRLFGEFDHSTGATTFPLVNIYDNKDTIVVAAELPGASKDAVSITYSDGMLTIAGNLESTPDIKNMAVIRQERTQGRFEKAVRLPAKVEQNKISASFINGILTITLPKSEEAKPKTIAIEAK
jgi:HSP20 family protein